MAVGPDPFVALLQSISDAQAASGAGSAAPFAPGAQGITAQGVQAGDASGGPPGAAAASIGPGGGSVPGTATTGASLGRQIVEGAIDPGSATAASLMDRVERSGESPERPMVAGGDIGTLMAMLGGPMAAFTMIPSLVASDAMGGPLDPSLLSTSTLAELAARGSSEPFGGNPPIPPPLPPSRQTAADNRENFGQVRTGQVPVPPRDPRETAGDRQRENFGQERTGRAPTPPRDPRR